ncbi:hypothetical protein LTR50_004719 [Elasticomyces elasticus]|nr:hypothetical protein LTR50_004719 [Elasticomyces elasticus]
MQIQESPRQIYPVETSFRAGVFTHNAETHNPRYWKSPITANLPSPADTMNTFSSRNGSYQDYFERNGSIREDRTPKQPIQLNDPIALHLLIETAVLDSQEYEVLGIEEVDVLKKELARVLSRIEGTNRRLALESKVRDAALSLHRLYSVKGRPDTPQSPKKARRSLLGNRGRSNSNSSITGSGDTLDKTEEELTSSVKKCEELTIILSDLKGRKQHIETKLLRHTAGILQVGRQQTEKEQQEAHSTHLREMLPSEMTRDDNGDRTEHDNVHLSGRSRSPYHDGEHEDQGLGRSIDHLDGSRDISNHKRERGSGRVGSRTSSLFTKKQDRAAAEAQNEKIREVQERLETLNSQLRALILSANPQQQNFPHPPGPNEEESTRELEERTDPIEQVGNHLDYLALGLRTMEEEQKVLKEDYDYARSKASHNQHAVEGQLHTINRQLHHLLASKHDNQRHSSELQGPPDASGNSTQAQLGYLEESLLTMEQLHQQLQYGMHEAQQTQASTARELEQIQSDAEAAYDGFARDLDEAQTRAANLANNVEHFETVLGGLWDIIHSTSWDASSPTDATRVDEDDEQDREPFTLRAFSAKVQHLFNQAGSLQDQQTVLRRQITQQRELNSDSDAEKDRDLTELRGRHGDLEAEHGTLRDEHGRLRDEHMAVQEELSRAIALHTAAYTEISDSRIEMEKVTDELDRMKRDATLHDDAVQRSRDEHASAVKQLEERSEHSLALQQELEMHETQIAALEAKLSDLTDASRTASAEAEARAQEHARRIEEMTIALTTGSAARETAESRSAAAETRAGELVEEIASLNQEVARLTTELTTAKADLDGAYRSRAQQAAEVAPNPELQAQLSAVESLKGRNEELVRELEALRHERLAIETDKDALARHHEQAQAAIAGHEGELERLRTQQNLVTRSHSDARARVELLEQELDGMTTDLQGLLREGVEVEKEREALEAVIDELRERCESLESSLTDERVRWLGTRSDGGGGGGGNGVAGQKETTSMMVLRNEFRKMMREMRAEGVRALRAEQEERKKLEALLRSVRREQNGVRSE